MIMKLGIEHYVLKLYKVYINDDPDLTMTYFTTMSKWRNMFLYLSCFCTLAKKSGEHL